MPLTLDDLDSPILTDQQTSFVGGQFSNAVPLQIPEDACQLLSDVEVSITGQCSTRRGTVQLGTNEVGVVGSLIRGLGFYNTPTNTYPIAIGGDFKIKKFNGATWVTLNDTQAFSNGSEPVTFVEGNAFLYVTDGLGNIRKWNGTAWSQLTTDSPPTAVKHLIWHNNRLVAANATIGGGPSVDGVFFSGILDDTAWASLAGGYQIQPGAGDGASINAIVSWSNFNIAVFKENSTWLIGADPLLDVSDMPVTLVHGRIGCSAPLSAVQVGSDILFLSQDGVRSLQQTIASDSRYELGVPLSFPVNDIIRRINPAYAKNAVATFWKGKYILAVPLDSSTVNNYLLIYDSVTGKWGGLWTLPVSCFGVRTDNNVDKLMMGLSNDIKVIEYLDYINDVDATDDTYTDYNGNFVQMRITTRGMIFGDLHSMKKGININVVMNKSKGALDIQAVLDEGETVVTKTIDTGDPFGFPIPFTLPIRFPRSGIQAASMDLMEHPEFYQLQINIIAKDAGRKEIRQITAQAFPEAVDLMGKFQATNPAQGGA